MPASVAIYEDDAAIRTLLIDLLEMEGLEIVMCRTIFELHQAAVAGARVAIADSWGRSYQILDNGEREQIRALARLLPTILISGRDWVGGVRTCELGPAGLLAKPFDIDELLRCVRLFITAQAEVPNLQPQRNGAFTASPSVRCEPDWQQFYASASGTHA